jgi:hypothetical protein
LPTCAKPLRKPQDKLIKQLLDAISTAAKEYQLSKNKDWKELNLKEQLDQLKALQQQLSGNPMKKNPACCTKPNISTNKPIGSQAVSLKAFIPMWKDFAK